MLEHYCIMHALIIIIRDMYNTGYVNVFGYHADIVISGANPVKTNTF